VKVKIVLKFWKVSRQKRVENPGFQEIPIFCEKEEM
jgi:hypothetical protein